jgi:D-alanyl-D-alanine dipeptidase
VLESNPEEAAAPTEVVHRVAVEAAQAVHMAVEAAPIVAHKGFEVVHRVAAEAVQAAHMVIEAAALNLAAAVGLDHKTWIIPSCQICNHF